jgi:hypothetical protein
VRAGRPAKFQRVLAIDQMVRSNIFAVQVEEIEGVKDQPGGVGAAKLAAECLKIRTTLRTEHGDFSVQDSTFDLKLCRPSCDRSELLGPIVTSPRIDGDADVLPHVNLGPAAVDLEFVQPVVSHGSSVGQGRIAERYEVRWRRCF